MLFGQFKAVFEKRPFRPVRIFITSGETVDVQHPEQLLITPASFGFVISTKKGEVKDMGWYSLIHVVKVVPLSSLRRRKSRKTRTA